MDVECLQLLIGELKIPRYQAAKTRQVWDVTLRDQTTLALEEWLEQRAANEDYDDSAAVWLNRHGNRYSSRNLNDLLDNLLEAADIDQDNRKLTWYSFRKSTGQYVQSAADDLTAAAVLRSQPENVKHYATPTPEDRRRILDRLDQ
jgi:site-specific recombinase XerC